MSHSSKFLLEKTFNVINWKNSVIKVGSNNDLYFKYKISLKLIRWFLKNPLSMIFLQYKLHFFYNYYDQISFFKKRDKANWIRYQRRIYISQLNLLSYSYFYIFKISTVALDNPKHRKGVLDLETFSRLGLFYSHIASESEKVNF